MPEQAATTASVTRAIEGLDRLPPFSPVLNRLLATIASEDVSFAEVAALIESDAVMAGNVLKLVNSALFGFQGTVNSVRHAVAILGVNRLRNLTLSLSIARMWTHVRTPDGWSGAKFNQHALAVGLLSDLIVQGTPVPYPEGAFVAGLLHDIGKLLIATSLSAEFAGIQWMLQEGGHTELECEIEMIGVTHAELSGHALARWNLPRPIQRSATCHHSPDDADSGRLHLSHAVYVADQLAIELGHTVNGYHGPSGPAQEALEALNMPERMPRILDEFQTEFEVVKAFL
jgi:HD-like signal output (HDOD) protein